MQVKVKFVKDTEGRNWVVLGNYYYEDFSDDASAEDMNEIQESAESFLLQIHPKLKLTWPKSKTIAKQVDDGKYICILDLIKNPSASQNKSE